MDPKRQELLDALQAAYRTVLPNQERILVWDDELLDLGVASVAALEMAGILEDQYEIRFPEYELGQVRTVADFGELIARLREPSTQ